MSGMPAARLGDTIICGVPQLTFAALPHAPPPGLPIMPPCAPTVLIGGMPAARIGDQNICVGPLPIPNPIAVGAYPVLIQNMPAARLTDLATHPGSCIAPPCCPTVLIGLAGTAGNVASGVVMFQTMAAGRATGSLRQTYGNCGIESSRQLINQLTGSSPTELNLLQSSVNAALASGPSTGPFSTSNGGTSPATRQSILANNGVASTVLPTTAQNLGLATSRGQGVIVSLDAAFLWGGRTPVGSLHAVTVTGTEYDDAGNQTAVIINDTGNGQGGQRIPAAQFNQATAAHPNSQLNITDRSIF